MARDPGWHLYRSFLAVYRQRSLSGAARRLGLTQPTLGRHVAELEADLGLALFTRSQAGLAPTDVALSLLPLAEAMEAAAAAALRAATDSASELRGMVRITASEMMGTEVLPPLLAGIQAEQPRLAFELMLSNRTDNLLRREADIAVRMVRPSQAAILTRKLGEVRLGLFAHRHYLARHGAPASAARLGDFHVIGFDRDDHSARSVARGTLPIDRALFSFRVDSDVAQAAALRAGLGIGVMQARLAARHPDLVAVLEDEVRFRLEVWLAMHEDHRASRPVRFVFDRLGAGLEEWLRGDPEPERP